MLVEPNAMDTSNAFWCAFAHMQRTREWWSSIEWDPSCYREFYMCGTAKSQHEVSVRNLELNYICNSSSTFLLPFFFFFAIFVLGSCAKLECNAHVCFVVAISLRVTCIVSIFQFSYGSWFSFSLFAKFGGANVHFWWRFSFDVASMWLTELCLSSKSIYNWNQLYCMHTQCTWGTK